MGPEVLRHRPQCGDRQEEQGPDDENRPEQEDAKGGGVGRAESPGQTGLDFFAPRNAAMAIGAIIGR